MWHACMIRGLAKCSTYIDADGIIKGGTASTAVVDLRRHGGGERFPNE